MQKEITELEAELARLRMLKILPCSDEQLKAVTDRAMQSGLERHLVAALQTYARTPPMAGPEDAAKAGEVLRAAVWTSLNLMVTTRPQQHAAPLAVAAASGNSAGAPPPFPCPPPPERAFTHVGAQTTYTAHTMDRQYDASGPPPYPCSRCHGNHWS